ncbi:MAG: 4-(cytidine 5'-diphospho)-2-C-methyl-D-erythritol kinase, partial [Acidobacteriota bacterium]|nr:4-(cytidine 5'-diphospho)-2-C-methyl-D-erythritol kinase [Acidobacteriota bacterium]
VPMSGDTARRSARATITRETTVRAFAKINLSLRILHKRPDQFHELRSVFQTISLSDELQIRFTPLAETSTTIDGNIQIADNLVERAARLCLDEIKLTGAVEFVLRKRIPMGAGLGGGSSDAAAVLLALPVLAGRIVPLERLLALASQLGSDVAFFLLGGTAIGLGRGEEIYPLPDRKPARGVLIAPDIHVATADAYRALSARLTTHLQQNKLVSFQSETWQGNRGRSENDFEEVVFERHPNLKLLKSRLRELGAKPAMMTGSGSALFGIFESRDQISRALESFKEESIYPISLVSRASYRSVWLRRLRPHIQGDPWPPRSRYAQ